MAEDGNQIQYLSQTNKIINELLFYAAPSNPQNTWGQLIGLANCEAAQAG